MTTTVSAPATRPYDSTRVYQDGIVAGILAAIAVAVWFLIFDTARGHPLYTPSVLGTALFRREAPLVPGMKNEPSVTLLPTGVNSRDGLKVVKMLP